MNLYNIPRGILLVYSNEVWNITNFRRRKNVDQFQFTLYNLSVHNVRLSIKKTYLFQPKGTRIQFK